MCHLFRGSATRERNKRKYSEDGVRGGTGEILDRAALLVADLPVLTTTRFKAHLLVSPPLNTAVTLKQ